jgi:hypothetical protein
VRQPQAGRPILYRENLCLVDKRFSETATKYKGVKNLRMQMNFETAIGLNWFIANNGENGRSVGNAAKSNVGDVAPVRQERKYPSAPDEVSLNLVAEQKGTDRC